MTDQRHTHTRRARRLGQAVVGGALAATLGLSAAWATGSAADAGSGNPSTATSSTAGSGSDTGGSGASTGTTVSPGSAIGSHATTGGS